MQELTLGIAEVTMTGSDKIKRDKQVILEVLDSSPHLAVELLLLVTGLLKNARYMNLSRTIMPKERILLLPAVGKAQSQNFTLLNYSKTCLVK
jgi:hypothetical protein